jgi:hypothetical protein
MYIYIRSRERIKQHPWAANIKSVTSLGGVLWGTEMADTTQQEGHMNKHALDLIVNCSQALDYSHVGDLGTLAHMKEVATNTKHIVELAVKLAGADFPTKPHPAMSEEFSAAPEVDFGGLAKLLHMFLFKQFRLNEPVADYYGNIKTMKILVEKLLGGIDGLRTNTRMRWWKKNKLPTDVKYYTIAGTMQDAEGDVHVVERDVAFSINSVDFRFNRQFFYDSYTLTDHNLHDGQMGIQRTGSLLQHLVIYLNFSSSLSFYLSYFISQSIYPSCSLTHPLAPLTLTVFILLAFWPSLHRIINPSQGYYYSSIISVINAHHWGMALPGALDNPVLKTNPFPRTTLMKALGAFLVRDGA